MTIVTQSTMLLFNLKNEDLMFEFFKGFGDAIKSGHRAGNIVNIVQKVVGRSLSSNEKEQIKNYFDQMNFSERVSDDEIAIDLETF